MLWVPSNPDGVKSKRGIATEKVIRRLMKSEHLRVYVPRIKRFSSYQGEISPDVPNLLQRNFHADKLNQKWLTDITEFSIPSGKVYLSPVIDYLFGWTACRLDGRNTSGWAISQRNAIESDGSAKNPINHSDRGAHNGLLWQKVPVYNDQCRKKRVLPIIQLVKVSSAGWKWRCFTVDRGLVCRLTS